MDSINTHKIHANKICPPSPTPPTPPPTEKPPTKKPFVKCGLVTAFDEQFVHQTYEKLKKLSGNITKKTKEEMIECFEINLKCFKSIKQLQNLVFKLIIVFINLFGKILFGNDTRGLGLEPATN
mgnify:CR=1 FL=1